MAADLSHLLSVDKIKHKYGKTVKDFFCILQEESHTKTYYLESHTEDLLSIQIDKERFRVGGGGGIKNIQLILKSLL